MDLINKIGVSCFIIGLFLSFIMLMRDSSVEDNGWAWPTIIGTFIHLMILVWNN